jgi:hypothetical protein
VDRNIPGKNRVDTKSAEKPGIRIAKSIAAILELKKILERMDYRYNPLVHVPLNIFLLWDLNRYLHWRNGNREKEKLVAQWLSGPCAKWSRSSPCYYLF